MDDEICKHTEQHVNISLEQKIKQKDFTSQSQDKQGHCKTPESFAWGPQRAGCYFRFLVRYILYVNPYTAAHSLLVQDHEWPQGKQ